MAVVRGREWRWQKQPSHPTLPHTGKEHSPQLTSLIMSWSSASVGFWPRERITVPVGRGLGEGWGELGVCSRVPGPPHPGGRPGQGGKTGGCVESHAVRLHSPSSLVVMVPSPSLSNREKASLNSAICGRGRVG